MPDIDPTLLLSLAAVFLAALTHGLAGFGYALVAMPLLVLWMDIRAAAPLVALLTVTTNALFLAGLRKSLVPGRIVRLLAGALLGVPLGILFLRHGDPGILGLTLGVVLIVYSLRALFVKRRPPGMGRQAAVLLGIVSGFLGGAINTGGPPAVIYITAQPWSKREIHATLQFYFILVGGLIVLGHALTGLTTAATLRMYGVLLPASLAGCAAGYALHRKVGQEAYHRLVYSLLLALGILMLWR